MESTTHSETNTPQYRLPDLAGLSLNEPQKQNHEDKLQNARQYSPTGVIPDEEMPDVEEDIMVDSSDLTCDSSSATSSMAMDGSSYRSSRYSGYIENGRRYPSTGLQAHFAPTDDTQWASQEAGHLVFLILDCQRANPLFRSELSPDAKYVLDLGTGKGDWAIDVADRFPNLKVTGVDLLLPNGGGEWVPGNCRLEMDDVLKCWAWEVRWDLIHMRYCLGSFSNEQWDYLYRQSLKNLKEGGWFEHVENDIGWWTDDNSLPDDNALSHCNWRETVLAAAAKAQRPLDVYDTMRSRMERAGFTNIQEQQYKIPIGTWPKHPIYKDAGRVAAQQMKGGMEGWVMWLLTKFGERGEERRPWTAEEVKEYLEEGRRELDRGWRIYLKVRRVWAQKLVDGEEEEEL